MTHSIALFSHLLALVSTRVVCNQDSVDSGTERIAQREETRANLRATFEKKQLTDSLNPLIEKDLSWVSESANRLEQHVSAK